MSDILVDALCHYGVEGQKWGERRYQNYDGTLTDEGRRHYGYSETKKAIKKAKRQAIESGYNMRRSREEYGRVGEAMQQSFAEDYKRRESELREMVNDAKEKYGDTKIKDLKYKQYYNQRTGEIEDILTGSTIDAKDIAVSAGKTMVGTLGLGVLGIPLIYLDIPTSERHNKKAYKKASNQFYENYYRNLRSE